MRKFLRSVLLAAALVGVAAADAGATVGPAMLTDRNPTGTGSNTAATAGFPGAPNLAASVFTVTGGGVAISCPHVDLKFTALTTNTMHFGQSFGPNCTTTLSGITLATTIDVNCHWTLTFQNAVFNHDTGATANITQDQACPNYITVPAVGCTITIAAGRYGHLEAQNVGANGAATASTSPTGMILSPTITGLTYTTNAGCPGIPTPGTLSYRGPMYIHNVWVML